MTAWVWGGWGDRMVLRERQGDPQGKRVDPSFTPQITVLLGSTQGGRGRQVPASLQPAGFASVPAPGSARWVPGQEQGLGEKEPGPPHCPQQLPRPEGVTVHAAGAEPSEVRGSHGEMGTPCRVHSLPGSSAPHSEPRRADRGVGPPPWGTQPAVSAALCVTHLLLATKHQKLGDFRGHPFRAPCIPQLGRGHRDGPTSQAGGVRLSWELLLQQPTCRQDLPTPPQAWAPGSSVGGPSRPLPSPPRALTTARPSQTHTAERPPPAGPRAGC